MDEEFGALLGSIYEAAVIPEKWPEVILALAERFGFWGGWFFATDDVTQDWVMSVNVRPAVTEFLAGGWASKDQRLERILRAPPNGFLSDRDIFSEAEISEMPLYRDFLHPRGFGYGAATIVETPGANRVVLALERRLTQGPAKRQQMMVLDSLRPHIARAVMLTSYTIARNAQIAVDALNAIGAAAAVIGTKTDIIAANSKFDRLGQTFIYRAFGRIGLADRAGSRQLNRALLALDYDNSGSVRSIAIPGTELQSACVIHVIPFRGRSQEIFTGSKALIVVSTSDETSVIPETLLRGLYDLTSAEAHLAKLLLQGLSLKEAAGQLSVSYETVRTQLKSVFAKTGAHSQPELIRRLAPFGSRSSR